MPAVADGQTHIAFMGTVTFSVKGMVDLYLSNLKYPEKTGAVDEMLGIDQALDIVREHLGKGLNPRQDKAVERIDLCYRYVQDTVTEEYSADPVWLFYMEADPLMSGDYSNSTGKQAKRVKYDECFVVDVRSGLLEVVSTSTLETA